MNTKLHIGEVAKLLGITPKTIRHYHKVGLLTEPQRTESGYRLYTASALLRLQRIRRLQALGLSLKQIKTLLGEHVVGQESSLRDVLQSLLEELSTEITSLEEQRERIRMLLASDTIDIISSSSPTLELAKEHFGEQLAFFQQVHTLVTTHGLSDIFFTIGYASILAFVLTFEQAPNAISGEGNRLSLYLTAPFSSAAIFLAKLAAFILPAIMTGLATDLFLSWRIGLPLTAIVYNTIAIVLVISGCIAPPVLGSIWEENLNLPVEGTIQIILQEEAAVSPKRLLLVYLSVLLLAVSLLILWKLPPILAIATLLSLDITIVAAMLQLSRTYLRQLIRAG